MLFAIKLDIFVEFGKHCTSGNCKMYDVLANNIDIVIYTFLLLLLATL